MIFNSPDAKRRYVKTMFSRIAARYDLMNRLMTGGQDRRWRQLLVRQAHVPAGGSLLDIATGTGDIAFEALRQQPNLRVVGADFTLPMMQVGRQRAEKTETTRRVSWCGADTLHLPFPDNSFDAVASGFLMRNVTSLPQALGEQRRACKPGGRVLILEIPRPANTLWSQIFRLYFHGMVPVLGGLITGQREAYRYLPASADTFLRPDELKAEMEQAGLRQVSYMLLMFNTVALHSGVK
jgi:demethylmenaquinone methyltransferase/2-methoxy-6-polyprenyl-1,4-benzoquinol methylase